jgi:hypothetical protein
MRSTVLDTPPAPEAPRAIKSAVPNRRVLRAINPFVCAILRSPFHRLLSGQVLLLTYAGRRSGRRFTIPVGYMPDGDVLTVFSGQRWPRNLHDGATVTIELQGRRVTAHAEVVAEPAAVLAETERMIAALGAPQASIHIGIALDLEPPPSRDELARALQSRTIIRLRLNGMRYDSPG